MIDRRETRLVRVEKVMNNSFVVRTGAARSDRPAPSGMTAGQ
jgi:hypothetical protein